MTITFGNGQKMRFWFSYQGHGTFIHCETNSSTYSAAALCARSDLFVKAKGRRVALTRFLKAPLADKPFAMTLHFNREALGSLFYPTR